MNSKNKCNVLVLSTFINEKPSTIDRKVYNQFISDMYIKYNIFVWDDLDDIYYTHTFEDDVNGCNQHINFKQDELNWVLRHPDEIATTYYINEINKLLTSNDFIGVKKLLPLLGKVTGEDYSTFAAEEFPSCILSRLFKINEKDVERSFEISKPKYN